MQVHFADVATVFDFALVVVNGHIVLEPPVLFSTLVCSYALVLLKIVVIAFSLVFVLVLAIEFLMGPISVIGLADHDEHIKRCQSDQ